MPNGKKISSSFLIGVFVISGVALLIAFLIWMGATQYFKEQVYFVTYFEGSVEGLNVGSAVKYQGVPCGSVSKIQVAEDGRLVEVILQVDDKIKITDSLRVKSELSGIAGGKFLQLFYTSDPVMMASHPNLSFKPKYTYIKSAPSGIEEIQIAMRDVVNNLMKLQVGEISKGTVEFLNASTQFFSNEDLYKMISELSESSKRLHAIMNRADTSNIISNLAGTSYKLNQTSEELKLFAENLNAEITRMNLPEYISKMYEKYDTTMYNTNKSIGTITYRMESLLFGLNETFEEIRVTNRNLQKTLRTLNDNPSQIFLTEPPPQDK